MNKFTIDYKFTFILRSISREEIVVFTIEHYNNNEEEARKKAYSWLLDNGYMKREAFYKLELIKVVL